MALIVLPLPFALIVYFYHTFTLLVLHKRVKEKKKTAKEKKNAKEKLSVGKLCNTYTFTGTYDYKFTIERKKKNKSR